MRPQTPCAKRDDKREETEGAVPDLLLLQFPTPYVDTLGRRWVAQAHARPPAALGAVASKYAQLEGWIVFLGADGRILTAGPLTAPVSRAVLRGWASGLLVEDLEDAFGQARFEGAFAVARDADTVGR